MAQVAQRSLPGPCVNARAEDGVAVLVVGAGPVGLVLACELARRAVPFRLIDRLTEPTDESRAIIVHARSLELMERIGVVDALIASGVAMTAMTFHDRDHVLGRLELDAVDSPYPFSISTAQTETERVLTERLAALGGAIERGVELVALEQDEREVRSTLRHADGSTETLVSSFVAGTDGSHSTVRHQIGTKLEGSFVGERFLLGDVEGDYELDRDSMHTYFSADAGPLLVFPMLNDRLRLIAQIDDTCGTIAPKLAALQELCDERAGGIALRSAHWITIFEIHHAQVPHYCFGRVLLAGDAAHVHSPAGAQGMNTGMQDAFNLGWKLALAASGDAAPGLLASYERERHPVAARVIEQTTRLTDAGTLRHSLARRLRNQAIHLATGSAPIRMRLADQTEEIDVGYRGSPIVASAHVRHGGPLPGDAAPDVPGVDPPLHRALAAGRGHTALYIAGEGAPPARLALDAPDVRHVLVARAAAASESFDEVVADADRLIGKRYGAARTGAVVLVRPDGYVGLHARLGDEEAGAAYLARIYASRAP